MVSRERTVCDYNSESPRFSETSNGAFDPTVGPIVNLWGFGPDAGVDALPSDSLIEETKSQIGFSAIEVELPSQGGSCHHETITTTPDFPPSQKDSLLISCMSS